MRPCFRHLLPLTALLAAGCELYPEDPIYAYGQVLRADGSPVSGATLSFERTLSLMDFTGRTVSPPDFSPHATASSREDGAFTLELLAGDTSERVRNGEYYDYRLYRFRAVSPLEEGRAAILSFESNGDVELPPLKPWAAELAVGEGAAGHLAVSFAPVPPPPETPPTASLRFAPNPYTGEQLEIPPTIPRPVVQLLHGGTVLWQQEVGGSPWMAAPWLREDFEGLEVMVRAQSTGDWDFAPLGGRLSSVGFRLEWRGERLPMPGAGLRPASRGASCEPRPVGASECPWTDGQLVPVKLPLTATRPVNRWPETLSLTLAAPSRPSRIVVRGLATSSVTSNPLKKLLIEGSEDGERWLPLGEVVRPALAEGRDGAAFRDYREVTWGADSPFDPELQVSLLSNLYLEGALRTEVAVRHVRLRGVLAEGTRPAEFESLREVSLFE